MARILDFKARVWLYPGAQAAWHFISLPKKEAAYVKSLQDEKPRRGWGAVKVNVTIGASNWTTSIFPDKKTGTYLLPLKCAVRKREGIQEKDEVKIKLEILI